MGTTETDRRPYPPQPPIARGHLVTRISALLWLGATAIGVTAGLTAAGPALVAFLR